MKKINKFIKWIIITMLCMIFGMFFITAGQLKTAFALSLKDKVLFIVMDEEEKESLQLDCEECEFVNDLFDIGIISNINTTEINSYVAVALPYEFVKNTEICSSINNERIYLYGDLTISDYKEKINIDEFALDVKIEDTKGTNISYAKQYLDEEYENTHSFNVICYGENNTLLCTIGQDASTFSYLFNIIDNFQIIIKSKFQRTTVIESKFDFTSSINSQRSYGVAHLDYTLYRNYDEQDSTYDYFGIKTKTWITTSADVKEIKTKYELPEINDNLMETGPASKTSANNLDVSIGFGNGGVNGTIGFSVDLSDYTPNITRTEDYTNDTVEWSLTPKTLLPKSINGATLDCVATWASLSSRNNAAIDVYFTGTLSVDGPRNSKINIVGTYLQVPVRFSY